jgi:broad specificity phosphatase PhoE
MASLRVCFVRHGETLWNVDRRFQGQLDIPLNSLGIQQAKAVGRHFGSMYHDESDGPIVAIYSSDLSRARQTAVEINVALGEQLEIKLDAALRERDCGEFAGKTPSECVKYASQEFHAFTKRLELDARPANAESLQSMADRIDSFLDRLMTQHCQTKFLSDDEHNNCILPWQSSSHDDLAMAASIDVKSSSFSSIEAPQQDFKSDIKSTVSASSSSTGHSKCLTKNSPIILVVTHGGVLNLVHRRAHGQDLRGPRAAPIPNAGLNWVELSWAVNEIASSEESSSAFTSSSNHRKLKWKVLSWAQTEHLKMDSLDDIM